MAMLDRTGQMRLVATGPPSVRARTALAARVMGWTLAKACSQPGMLRIEVKTELANTIGKMGRKPASCAVSGSATVSPMRANTHDRLYPSSRATKTAATAGTKPLGPRKPTAHPPPLLHSDTE